MTIFKKTFLNFLVLAIIACSIFSSNVTISQAASHMDIGTAHGEEEAKATKEAILDDMGLTKKDLASKKKATNISERLSELIPEGVDDYARQKASALIETVKKNRKNFGVTIEKYANVEIKKPFIIYSAEHLGKQYPVYYYPISNHGKIILVLYVTGYGGDYTACINTDYTSMLNKLDYQNNEDYLFYENGQNLYAENNDTAIKITNTPRSKDNALSSREEKNAKVFKSLTTKNKIDAILHSYEEKEDTNETPKKNIRLGAKGFSTKKGFVVRLNTSGCLVPQNKKNNTCWAACVATALRYLNYSKYKSLTAKQVCDKMKIKYSEGGSNDDERRALKKYGFNSKVEDYKVSFETVKQDILAQKPLLISAYGNRFGHTYIIVGYTTYGGINQITYYDPFTNACTSIEYRKKIMHLLFRNDPLRWDSTLRCK